MANLSETPVYDAGVYQLETTDKVGGGPSGKSNSPHKNLANRTAWLKAQVDALISAVAGLASSALALASDAEAIAGTITNKAVHPHGLAAALAAGGGGIGSGGQVWQDVSASRSVNTVYQNTTGKAIVVIARDSADASEIRIGSTAAPATTVDGGHIEVPPGWYYKLHMTVAPSILTWYELR